MPRSTMFPIKLAGALLLAASSCTEPASPGMDPLQVSRSETETSGLTGRIVYTLSGNLRIYHVATKADVALGVSGVNPRFSPDGRLIAYQNSGIWLMNSDGSDRRLLHASGGGPAFDPTGSTIAFGDDGAIRKINVDGTGLTLLTNAGRKPAWSPDGTQIAFQRTVGGIEQLFLMNADGSDQRQILTSPAVLDPVWLPSSRIAFSILSSRSNYELHSLDPTDPASLVRLTDRKGNDFEPSWSPDGGAIAWASLGKPAGIWMMNADGSGQHGPVISKGRQGSWGPL